MREPAPPICRPLATNADVARQRVLTPFASPRFSGAAAEIRPGRSQWIWHKSTLWKPPQASCRASARTGAARLLLGRESSALPRRYRSPRRRGAARGRGRCRNAASPIRSLYKSPSLSGAPRRVFPGAYAGAPTVSWQRPCTLEAAQGHPSRLRSHRSGAMDLWARETCALPRLRRRHRTGIL